MKSQPSTSAFFRSGVAGSTPVSTTAITTLGSPLEISQAAGMLTVRWPQARAQDGSFGVIAAAFPAHASTVTTTARSHPQVLTGPSVTEDPEEGESREDFSKYLPLLDRSSRNRPFNLANGRQTL